MARKSTKDDECLTKGEIVLSIIAYSGGTYSVQELKQILELIEKYEHRQAVVRQLRIQELNEE